MKINSYEDKVDFGRKREDDCKNSMRKKNVQRHSFEN